MDSSERGENTKGSDAVIRSDVASVSLKDAEVTPAPVSDQGGANDWETDPEEEKAFKALNAKYAHGPGRVFQDQKLFCEQEFPRVKISCIPAGCEDQAIRRECETCGPVHLFTFIHGRNEGDFAHAFVAFKVRLHKK